MAIHQEPTRWAVVWWADGVSHQEAYFSDRALAEAYAAARRGRLVPLVALVPWPEKEMAAGD